MNRQSLAFRKNRSGMTLFEVMIALSVFVLVAFSAVIALNTSFEAARRRNDAEKVTLGLENQVALLQSSPLIPGGRDMPNDDSGISYHVEVTPAQLQDQKHRPVTGIYRATITAKWQSGVETEERSVTELIYQP